MGKGKKTEGIIALKLFHMLPHGNCFASIRSFTFTTTDFTFAVDFSAEKCSYSMLTHFEDKVQHNVNTQ